MTLLYCPKSPECKIYEEIRTDLSHGILFGMVILSTLEMNPLDVKYECVAIRHLFGSNNETERRKLLNNFINEITHQNENHNLSCKVLEELKNKK